MTILDEEPLVDPLVGDNERDLWHLIVDAVGLGNSLLELGHLTIEDLLSLSVTHSIPVDDEVRGELATILLLEGSDSVLESLLHLSLDDLLASLLDQILTVILTHGLVD